MSKTKQSFLVKFFQWLKTLFGFTSHLQAEQAAKANQRDVQSSSRDSSNFNASPSAASRSPQKPQAIAVATSAKPTDGYSRQRSAASDKAQPDITEAVPGAAQNPVSSDSSTKAVERKASDAIPTQNDKSAVNPVSEVTSGAISNVSESGVDTEKRTKFVALGLDERLLKGIADLGFPNCTPIQAETLPQTLEGKDLIGQAQTGTGKTAAFLITLIQRCLKHPIPLQQRYAGEPRALVIAPTRELVMQIERDAVGLAKYAGLNVMAVVGGMSYDQQRERLRNEAVDLLIATPGRLLDFAGSKDLYLDQVEIMVIDEADRMLDMGFIPDVKRIVRAASKPGRQTLLFSATFSQDILTLAQRWTNSPAMIEIEPAQVTAERVEQIVYMIAADQKPKLLVNLLRKQPEAERVIIFCNRRDETRKLHDYLTKKNISTAMISGELPQQKRVRTLERFRDGEVRVLVATDVAGRGIHVEGVSHVINYNLPEDPEDYVHRIGRTGRAGTTGVSISFACEDDSFLIPEVEKYIGQKLSLVHPGAELVE